MVDGRTCITENDVVNALRKHFERDHKVLGFAHGYARGVDLAVCLSDGSVLFVEAKGCSPGTKPKRQRLACQLAWDSGFARLPQLEAGVKEIWAIPEGGSKRQLVRQAFKPDCVGIAVPDLPYFREHFRRFEEHMLRNGFGVWFVNPDGSAGATVIEVLAPRCVTSR
jgi:hypothetical protein